jgi:magnesium-transporting ATPase (P-type)
MSCVAKTPDGLTWCLVKGSPEHIKSKCVSHSVPPDYDDVLASYTARGMRTIALAGQQLQDPTIGVQRDAVESGLTLFGLLVLQNPLKGDFCLGSLLVADRAGTH